MHRLQPSMTRQVVLHKTQQAVELDRTFDGSELAELRQIMGGHNTTFGRDSMIDVQNTLNLLEQARTPPSHCAAWLSLTGA